MDEEETFQVVDQYWKDIDPFWEHSALDYEGMYDYITRRWPKQPRLNRRMIRERLEHLRSEHLAAKSE